MARVVDTREWDALLSPQDYGPVSLESPSPSFEEAAMLQTTRLRDMARNRGSLQLRVARNGSPRSPRKQTLPTKAPRLHRSLCRGYSEARPRSQPTGAVREHM
jgi:hypothetical protein